jgi:hypothetical protein
MEVNTINIKFSAIGLVEELFFEGVLVYRVNPEKVTGFVGITEETILGATVNQIKGVVGDKIKSMSLDMAKAKREELNDLLTKIFSSGSEESPFEAEFCIIVKQVRLAEVKGSQKLQKTRDARAEAEEMFKSAAALLGIPHEEVARRIRDKEMSHGQLIDLMNVLLGKSGEGSVNANSYRLAGTDGLEAAIANAFSSFLTRGEKR